MRGLMRTGDQLMLSRSHRPLRSTPFRVPARPRPHFSPGRGDIVVVAWAVSEISAQVELDVLANGAQRTDFR